MNNQTLWQRYQEWLYFHSSLDLYVDVSRMRFDDAFLAMIAPKFNDAFQAMDALEAGAIANPDENRMVGHYWLRAPELAPAGLAQEITDAITLIEKFVADIHNGKVAPPTADKFTDIIFVGIGGSALGPQFVAEALAPDFPPLVTHFIDNTDPAGIDRILHRLQNTLHTSLVIVATKSGGTPETRNGMLEVKHAYQQQGLDFACYAVAVTMQGSKMDDLQHAENWLARFPMFDWVGGRTSEMSAVGLLSAALMGIDIRAMLTGAKIMDEATRIHDMKRNPAALLALSWYHSGHGKGEKDMVIIPYKDSLLLFSRYLQQLVMESLGKELDLDGNIVHQGITVYGNKGSTDQHAYVQQLREGVMNFFVTFIEVLEDRKGASIEVENDATTGDFLSGFMQGTREALYESERDSITVTIKRVDAQTVGALIALYERAVGFYGSLVHINAYHQPGVEAGKKVACQLLVLQRQILAVLRNEKQALSLAELAEKVGANEQIEIVYKIVRHLVANQRGISLQGDFSQPDTLRVSYH
jgi:glucose-6-phosphate isomerase